MKRILLLLILLLPLAALAEVHIGEVPPEDWAERELLRVTVLQTGRSDALLLECGGEAMLIDGGDASWATAVQHDLEKRGLTSFRYFLNTHPHNDHIEGLIHLMQQGVLPERFLSPFAADWHDGSYHDAAMKLAWEKGVRFRMVKSGDAYPLGAAQIHIYRTTAHTDMNSRSAIQLVAFGESRLLLCADLTGLGQKALLEELPQGALAAQIVKAPHHGENAIVAGFLDAVSPALLLCNSGADEAPDLARQAESRGLPLLFSGEGEIVLETDGTTWYVWQREKTGRDR